MLPEKNYTFHFSYTTFSTQTKINQLWNRLYIWVFKTLRTSLTRPYAPLPLEGDGDGTVEEPHTVESHSQYDECKAEEIINSHLSGIRVMKSEWNDCSQGAGAATWLSSWREKSVHSVSKCSGDWGQRDCGRFCNSINSYGSVLFCFVFDFMSSSWLQELVSGLCMWLLETSAWTQKESRKPAVSRGLATI